MRTIWHGCDSAPNAPHECDTAFFAASQSNPETKVQQAGLSVNVVWAAARKGTERGTCDNRGEQEHRHQCPHAPQQIWKRKT